MADPSVYLDEDHRRLTVSLKNITHRLAKALLAENKPDSAIAVLDKAMEMMPEYNVPYNYFNLLLAEHYHEAGAHEKANAIAERMLDIHEENLHYYFRFPERMADQVFNQKHESLGLLQRIAIVSEMYNQHELAERAENVFDAYYDRWLMLSSGRR